MWSHSCTGRKKRGVCVCECVRVHTCAHAYVGGRGREEVCYSIWKIIVCGRTQVCFLENSSKNGRSQLLFWKHKPCDSDGPSDRRKIRSRRVQESQLFSPPSAPSLGHFQINTPAWRFYAKGRGGGPWLPLPPCWLQRSPLALNVKDGLRSL